MGSKGKGKAEQGELGGMPERAAHAKAAITYLGALDQVADAKVHKDKCSMELVEALREAKVQSVTVMGRVVSLRHRAAEDIVKVTKPKER